MSRPEAAKHARDSHICRVSPEDVIGVNRILKAIRPDGFVCANDFTAAQLLEVLNALDVAVPGDIRMAGIDDVEYTSLLPLPLTTIHQPCAELGAAAVSTMLDRLRQPTMPPRDVFLTFTLVVRGSCRAAVRQAAAR